MPQEDDISALPDNFGVTLDIVVIDDIIDPPKQTWSLEETWLRSKG